MTRYPAFFAALVWLFTFSLGGCVSSQQAADSDEAASEAAPPVVAVMDLPKQELTADLLEDLLVADIAFYRNDVPTSLEILEEVAFKTRDPRIAELVSVRAISFEEYDIANNTADLWVELAPMSASAWNAKGIALVMIEEYDEAVESFRRVIDLTANKPVVMGRISKWLTQKLPPPVAYQVYEQLLSYFPDSVDMHIYLLEIAAWVKESDEIDALFEDAFRLAGQSDQVANAKFSLYIQTKRLSEAEEFAKQFLSKNPNSPMLRQTYANYLAQTGLYGEAVEQFEKLSSTDSLLQVGDLHRRANYLDMAERSYLDYQRKEPNDQEVFISLADLYLERKQPEEAKKWMRRITDGQLGFDKFLLGARYIAEVHGVEAAVETLSQYHATDDREVIGIYVAINEIYRTYERFQDSISTLNAALRQYPQNATLLLARSYSAAELDLITLVEQDVSEVLKIHPNNPSALNALGYTLADQTDRFVEALDLIERALEQRPHDPYILDSMGWVQYKLGNYDEAVEFLTIAIERRDDPVMAAHLGEVYWTIGQKRKARRIWNKAIKKSPDSKILIETIQRLDN